MTHGSLFTGIGGFDLAARWAGLTNLFQVEINEYCLGILKKHFPGAKQFRDIKDFNGKAFRGSVDILSGGFPCQPFSVAGKRKGLSDQRYLWPDMLRVVKEVQPAWVLAENVYGLVTLQRGLVLEKVCADLEGAGYEVQPYIVPACAVGAVHKRERLWVLAYSHHYGLQRELHENRRKKDRLPETFPAHALCDNEKQLPKPYVTGGYDGIPHRMDRIKALGNAIVPQVAYEFFKTIITIENLKKRT